LKIVYAYLQIYRPGSAARKTPAWFLKQNGDVTRTGRQEDGGVIEAEAAIASPRFNSVLPSCKTLNETDGLI
jgi:hypothetical protein